MGFNPRLQFLPTGLNSKSHSSASSVFSSTKIHEIIGIWWRRSGTHMQISGSVIQNSGSPLLVLTEPNKVEAGSTPSSSNGRPTADLQALAYPCTINLSPPRTGP